MVPIFNCWDLFRDNGYRFAVMHQRYRVEVEGLIFPLLLHLQKTTEIRYHFKKMYQSQHVGPL